MGGAATQGGCCGAEGAGMGAACGQAAWQWPPPEGLGPTLPPQKCFPLPHPKLLPVA